MSGSVRGRTTPELVMVKFEDKYNSQAVYKLLGILCAHDTSTSDTTKRSNVFLISALILDPWSYGYP